MRDPVKRASCRWCRGDALFVIERRTWWQGEAITWVRLLHPAERFRLVTRDVM